MIAASASMVIAAIAVAVLLSGIDVDVSSSNAAVIRDSESDQGVPVEDPGLPVTLTSQRLQGPIADPTPSASATKSTARPAVVRRPVPVKLAGTFEEGPHCHALIVTTEGTLVLLSVDDQIDTPPGTVRVISIDADEVTVAFQGQESRLTLPKPQPLLTGDQK